MNKRLTDYEDAKESVIGHARAMRKKPELFRPDKEEDTMLDVFFDDK